MNCSILGFELGRPIRQSMEDVTVGEPKVLVSSYGQGESSQSSDNNYAGRSDLNQHIRQQRVALFNIMATCGYLL